MVSGKKVINKLFLEELFEAGVQITKFNKNQKDEIIKYKKIQNQIYKRKHNVMILFLNHVHPANKIVICLNSSF